MFSFDFLHNCDRQFYMPVQLGANALLAPLPHISAVIMYRGPGRPRVGVSALSSVLASPSTMLLHPSFFKKTWTERGSVPHFPTRHSPVFPLHTPCSPSRPPPHVSQDLHLSLFPSNSPVPIWVKRLTSAPASGTQCLHSLLCQQPAGALKNREITWCCTWVEKKEYFKS